MLAVEGVPKYKYRSWYFTGTVDLSEDSLILLMKNLLNLLKFRVARMLTMRTELPTVYCKSLFLICCHF